MRTVSLFGKRECYLYVLQLNIFATKIAEQSSVIQIQILYVNIYVPMELMNFFIICLHTHQTTTFYFFGIFIGMPFASFYVPMEFQINTLINVI